MKISKQTLSHIKHILKENKDGITIDLKGNISNNKKGYYCSVTNNTFKALKNKDILRLLNRAKNIRQNKGIKTYLGYWKDKRNNHFLDISQRFISRQKAIKTGVQYNQQAIFNIASMNTMFLR